MAQPRRRPARVRAEWALDRRDRLLRHPLDRHARGLREPDAVPARRRRAAGSRAGPLGFRRRPPGGVDRPVVRALGRRLVHRRHRRHVGARRPHPRRRRVGWRRVDRAGPIERRPLELPRRRGHPGRAHRRLRRGEPPTPRQAPPAGEPAGHDQPDPATRGAERGRRGPGPGGDPPGPGDRPDRRRLDGADHPGVRQDRRHHRGRQAPGALEQRRPGARRPRLGRRGVRRHRPRGAPGRRVRTRVGPRGVGRGVGRRPAEPRPLPAGRERRRLRRLPRTPRDPRRERRTRRRLRPDRRLRTRDARGPPGDARTGGHRRFRRPGRRLRDQRRPPLRRGLRWFDPHRRDRGGDQRGGRTPSSDGGPADPDRVPDGPAGRRRPPRPAGRDRGVSRRRSSARSRASRTRWSAGSPTSSTASSSG